MEGERGEGKRGNGKWAYQQEEQRENLLATQSEEKNEFGPTNRRIRDVCVGVALRVNSKLSCTLHAQHGTKLPQDLLNLESIRE